MTNYSLCLEIDSVLESGNSLTWAEVSEAIKTDMKKEIFSFSTPYLVFDYMPKNANPSPLSFLAAKGNAFMLALWMKDLRLVRSLFYKFKKSDEYYSHELFAVVEFVGFEMNAFFDLVPEKDRFRVNFISTEHPLTMLLPVKNLSDKLFTDLWTEYDFFNICTIGDSDEDYLNWLLSRGNIHPRKLFDSVDENILTSAKNLIRLKKECPGIYANCINANTLLFVLAAAKLSRQKRNYNSYEKAIVLLKKADIKTDSATGDRFFDMYFTTLGKDRDLMLNAFISLTGGKVCLNVASLDMISEKNFEGLIVDVDKEHKGFNPEKIQKGFLRAVNKIKLPKGKIRNRLMKKIIDRDDIEYTSLAIKKGLLPLERLDSALIYALKTGKKHIAPFLIAAKYSDTAAC